MAELLLTAPFAPLPPTLGLALVWSCGIAVVACGAALAMAVQLARIRTAHSDLVGGMLGPLLVVATTGPALVRLSGLWAGAAVLGCGLALLVGSLVGAHLAERLEGARPALPGLTWTGASLLLAGLAWNLYGSPTGTAWTVHAAIPIGVLLGALGLRGRAPGRPGPPRTRFGGLLLGLAVAASAAPFWPWWLPWLLYDRTLPEVGSWPPNVVFVALRGPNVPQEGPSEPTPASLELLRSAAVSYLALAPEPQVGSLLTLPDGSRLGEHLYAGGYATAAIGAMAADLRELGFSEADDRPGGRRLLEESAAWMGGAPLLLGPASGLVALLGHDRELRSVEQVAGEAARWILTWRTMRAPAPFFLAVDLRTPDANPEALDAGLRAILDRVEGLELDAVTLVVIAVETPGSRESGPGLRALVMPPSTWALETPLDVSAQVWGRALGQSLLQIVSSDGASGVRLPGLDQELLLPEARKRIR